MEHIFDNKAVEPAFLRIIRTVVPVAINMLLVSLSVYAIRKIVSREFSLKKKVNIGGKTLYLSSAEYDVSCDIIDPSGITTTFGDVGGLEKEKATLRQHVVLPFKHSEHLSKNSIRSHPKGILLYGPPGSGKTMLARALAKELGCSFINVKADMMFSKWVGETEKHVAAIFSLAKAIQPTVIFVDELDSILSSRNDSDHAVVSHSKAIFMTEWDGLEKDTESKIIVVGATNRRTSIDAAILRRLPLQLEIGLPDIETRKKILNILLAHDVKEGAAKERLVQFVAEKTKNYSGADLEELCKAAAILTFHSITDDGSASEQRVDIPEITEQHFLEALTRVRGYNNMH